MRLWDGLGTRPVGMAENEASMRLVSLWDGLGMRLGEWPSCETLGAKSSLSSLPLNNCFCFN